MNEEIRALHTRWEGNYVETYLRRLLRRASRSETVGSEWVPPLLLVLLGGGGGAWGLLPPPPPPEAEGGPSCEATATGCWGPATFVCCIWPAGASSGAWGTASPKSMPISSRTWLTILSCSSSSPSCSMASSRRSPMISCVNSARSFSRAKFVMIFWIVGMFTALFILTMAFVTLPMASAMACCDLTVCNFKPTALRWLLNSMNLVM
mmetsp:Transcript_17113/g.55585  ORF Transcript_17113/g.55585 Transcript_17113/m.55585 type:complete len:207 (-) Transcript_17113:130-750(-)